MLVEVICETKTNCMSLANEIEVRVLCNIEVEVCKLITCTYKPLIVNLVLNTCKILISITKHSSCSSKAILRALLKEVVPLNSNSNLIGNCTACSDSELRRHICSSYCTVWEDATNNRVLSRGLSSLSCNIEVRAELILNACSPTLVVEHQGDNWRD